MAFIAFNRHISIEFNSQFIGFHEKEFSLAKVD